MSNAGAGGKPLALRLFSTNSEAIVTVNVVGRHPGIDGDLWMPDDNEPRHLFGQQDGALIGKAHEDFGSRFERSIHIVVDGENLAETTG